MEDSAGEDITQRMEAVCAERAVVEPCLQLGREAEQHGLDLMKLVMRLSYLNFGVKHAGVVKDMSYGGPKVMESAHERLAHAKDGVYDAENGGKEADRE